MDELLREMKISRQSAYDTFGGKRELFMSALSSYIAAASDRIKSVLTHPDRKPIDRIHDFLDYLTTRTTSASDHGCMMINTLVELGPSDAEIRALISRVLEGFETLLTRQLTLARDDGDLPGPLKPRAIARLIVITFQGALVNSKSDRSDFNRDAIDVVRSILKPV
jgi:TetR/AcrR family transcriptional repressor of nem operon